MLTWYGGGGWSKGGNGWEWCSSKFGPRGSNASKSNRVNPTATWFHVNLSIFITRVKLPFGGGGKGISTWCWWSHTDTKFGGGGGNSGPGPGGGPWWFGGGGGGAGKPCSGSPCSPPLRPWTTSSPWCGLITWEALAFLTLPFRFSEVADDFVHGFGWSWKPLAWWKSWKLKPLYD